MGYWGTCKTKIFCRHRKLPNHEVFDAEARGALLGLHLPSRTPMPSTPPTYTSACTTLKQYSNARANPLN